MLHLDEAREKIIGIVKGMLSEQYEGSRAVIIEDLFGKLRLVWWLPNNRRGGLKRLQEELNRKLGSSEGAGPYWTKEIWLASGAGGRNC